MKIKKLVESTVLKEDDDKDLEDINPATDSVEDIADAIQKDTEEMSDGEVEVSDAEAEERAENIKDTAEVVDADSIAIVDDDFEDAYVENRITHLLDKCYANSIKGWKRGTKKKSNLLIEGLPGGGKTAIVENWCDAKGLHLVAVNATDPKLETTVNGIPLRDITVNDRNALERVRDKVLDDLIYELNPKYEGKCVLFVDELNRQKTTQMRRPFMSLFNEKRNADGSLDFRKNLLFSVVCINPSGTQFHDDGVGELTPAERNRFLRDVTYNSDIEDAKKYFKGRTIGELLKLGVISPDSVASKHHGNFVGPVKPLDEDDLEYAKELVREYALASYMLNSDEFRYDTYDRQKGDYRDIQVMHHEGSQLFTARKFDEMIQDCEGDKEALLDLADNEANVSSRVKQMFHDILDRYIMDVNALYKRYGLDRTPDQIKQEVKKALAGGNADDLVDDVLEDEPIEADDTLFGDEDSVTTGKVAPSAADTEADVVDTVDSWI